MMILNPSHGTVRVVASLAAFVAVFLAPAAEDYAHAAVVEVQVSESQQKTIYHSPQTPGYTCWTCVWCMPDGSQMLTFSQVTGPLEGRKRASAEILQHMPGAQQSIAAYDVTGAKLENVYLHSLNGGKTWKKVGSELVISCMNGGQFFHGILLLRDGSLLRNVWGQSVRGQDPAYFDILPTGFLQRSSDGAKTWSKPEYVSLDPKLQTFPKRLRWLRDGRILMTGGACPYELDKWRWDEQCTKMRPCLWISKEPTGKSWAGPLYVASSSTEEWDVAELDNGDLLGVFRTIDQKRCQSLLVKHGETWEPGPLQAAPFPHSGQPELLATREGIILHIASDGVWWTDGRGTTWTKLNMPGTDYYPTAVQLNDGTVLVVSHVGSDNAYGSADQSITQQTFRLRVTRSGK